LYQLLHLRLQSRVILPMDRMLSPQMLLQAEQADRLAAAEFAAQHPEQSSACAAALARCAADRSEAIAMHAAEALEMLGPPPRSALADLIELLDPRGEGETTYWAVTLIGRLGPAAGPASHGLVQMLAGSPYLPVRERAAWALGRIGAAAQGSEQTLRTAAEQGPPRLARLATQALESIRGMAA
jgi:HEAT repeat protein